jgi:ABC-type transport system involved in multi-copper enzyme maturation permease subunit
VGEAIRRKVLLIILLIGLVFLFAAPGLSVLSARAENTVLKSFMLFTIQATGAAIAIVLTVYMIPNEVERRTIYTILSKPVQRWQFLVGKYLGAVAALAIMMGLMSIVLVGVFVIQQGVNATAVADLLMGPLMYFVQMSLLAAVAIFVSTFAPPLVNFFLSGGIFLLGTLFNPFFTSIQDNPGTPAVAKVFATIVNAILPNFASYNVQNPLINAGQQIQNAQIYYIQTIGYGLAYIAGLLIAGIVVFDRREV